MKILVLNAGSSSQKSRLYELDGTPSVQPPAALWEADADWSRHEGRAAIKVKTASGATLNEDQQADSRPAVIARMLDTLWHGPTRVIHQPSDIALVGHRVVHGGQDYRESVIVTPEVKETIKRLAAFAPVHNPANLEGIEASEQTFGSIPQVAVFDTAFHSQLPQEAVVYPGPYSWFEQGIRRYGFHGISHQYCAQRTAQLLGRDLRDLRLITCHLGNGCSLAAIAQGHSIDTTMGFTPLEGLMMGSRSGSVDPGILTYLLRQRECSFDELEEVLNKSSGLQGISGVSSDMREVLVAIAKGNTRAKLAFDMFVYRLRFYIGAMLANLGGLDALVFAGGIGENSAEVRAAACAAFGFLGLQIDQAKNTHSPADQDIATPESTTRVLVIQTQEDWAIAKECWRLHPHHQD
ncbi:MAG: acetate kinase [Ktedonobacteraceae bacterium]|nr:acetate kinase [Ktedonobacteraceae bacterium]